MKKKRVTKTQILDWLEKSNFYSLPRKKQIALQNIFTASSQKLMQRYSMILLKQIGLNRESNLLLKQIGVSHE